MGCAAGLAAIASLAACSGQGRAQEGAAATTAREFAQARVSDPSAACALLAPRTLEEVTRDRPCAEAVADGATDPGTSQPEVEVFGKDAIARFAGDTLFLALFDTGWKVTAASCQPTTDGRPYDCDVSGS